MAITTENTYVGDGSTVLYSFTFPYIDEGDVYITVDGTALSTPTEYIFANATTLQLTTAPTAGQAVRIYRQTSADDLKAVFFPGSAIRARDLNDNFTQNLYVTQEADRDATTATNAAEQAATSAAAAAASAASATGAVDTANQAKATADVALANSAAAQTAASAAQASASQAQTDVQTALTAVANALQYTLVANVAAIPSSPADSDAVEVTDSTGIESFTPLAGIPAGFVGIPALFVRIVYSQSNSTWEWVQYAANDPEARYLSSGENISELTNDAGYITAAQVPDNSLDIDSLPLLP